MNEFMIGVICGAFIGFFLGLILVCILILGKVRDNFMPRRSNENP